MKPISPSELRNAKIKSIPDFVIKIINDILIREYNDLKTSGEIIINQNELIKAIQKENNIPRQELFNNRWFDFECYFENEGWKVEYDKPAYNETYEPVFIFKKSRKKSTPK